MGMPTARTLLWAVSRSDCHIVIKNYKVIKTCKLIFPVIARLYKKSWQSKYRLLRFFVKPRNDGKKFVIASINRYEAIHTKEIAILLFCND